MDPTYFVDESHMPSQNMRDSLYLASGNVTLVTASKKIRLDVREKTRFLYYKFCVISDNNPSYTALGVYFLRSYIFICSRLFQTKLRQS